MFSSNTQILSDRSAPGIAGGVSSPLLQKSLFAEETTLPEKIRLISGHSAGSAFVTSDYTSLYRSVQDLGLCVGSCYPSLKSVPLEQILSSKEMALGYQTFGSITGINCLLGAIKLIHASSAMKYSAAIEDDRGLLSARLSVLEGLSLEGAGTSFVVFRALSVAGILEEAKPMSLLQRVTSGFVTVGLIFYTVFFAVLMTILGIQLHEGLKWKRKLGKEKDLATQIEILQKKIQLDPEKVLKKLIQKCGCEEAAKKELIEEAYALAATNLKKVLKELNIPDVPEESLKGIVDSALETEDKLLILGLSAKVKKAELKNQAKIGRAFSKTGLDALTELKELPNLLDKIRSGDAQAIQKGKKLVEQIKKANETLITESSTIIGVFVLGMIAMAAAIGLTGGIGLLVSCGIMFLFNIAMLGVDGYSLHKSYQEETPAPHDKKMLAFSSGLGLASFALMLGLALSGAVSMGTVPLVISGLLTALWLGQNAMTWNIINRNQRLEEEKNPTLELLLQTLEKEDYQRAEIMWKNLSEIHREMIASAFENTKNSREYVRAVIQKTELAKKERLDSLRQALMPHLVRL